MSANDPLLLLSERATLAAFAGEPGDFDALLPMLSQVAPGHPLLRLAEGFGLDAGEAGLVALLYAAAMSETVAGAVQDATRNDRRGMPLWLAQRLLPSLDVGHVAAGAVLMRFGFVAREADTPLIDARMWLDPAVIDRLAGVAPRDPAIASRFLPIGAGADHAPAGWMAAIREALVARGPDGLSPLLLGAHDIEAMAGGFAALGLQAYQLQACDIPADPEARDRLAQGWSREAALDGAALIILADELHAASAAAFAGLVAGHVAIAGTVPLPPMRRAQRVLPAASSPRDAALARWQRALGEARSARLGAGVVRVAAQFRLSAAEVDAVVAACLGLIDAAPDGEAALRILWHHAGRAGSATPVPGVTIVEPVYDWGDIILPAPTEAALRRIEGHVRHAALVLDQWGFGRAMGARGRGVVALFSGPSGTGKTMAAEVLASSLDLRMMLIDLSQIISKYVGETSKNIAAAFDAAERSGAVMVWNEGDAIWGARGSVGHATDRHVNAEVGDLLQRIEAFDGFTIVTTNMRHAIDTAFLRRFRFTIDFPMPAAAERVRLWQRAFPGEAPVEAIDWRALADLPLSGGSIRNIALGAAFLAAERGTAIDASLIEAELAEEMRKQDQPMPTIDWMPAGTVQ
ncbi:AAA family ATPase [Sphingopyxis macrogoltabida]|uniref:AAA+ ATPase domain-containing protein n=1 Tax=Sphingopyxis macrogoltabida TaxID=33050 RepID=A0AAC9AUQ8_SPHMC|nr:ATP-binding protein [Sphingopyxis macrogoltabida]ALJ13631.1 aspartyl-tRNA(Asn)/glutamyl-tRNA (Gln) amidotransferase subunit A [Sphingopyxis macrogoltabida]AMU88924.1 hypothetical protein ATM17_07690 [Sphingopyxis macrogoltabida]